MCEGKEECQYRYFGQLDTNICFGVHKYVEIDYTCFERGHTVEKNLVFEENVDLEKQWVLSFEFKPTGTTTEMTEILRVGEPAGYADHGDQTPGF